MNQTSTPTTPENLQPKTVVKFARKCSECGQGMDNGYIINDGTAYYCSDGCLAENHTAEEYEAMHNNGEGSSYWTEWECEEDAEYFLGDDGLLHEIEPTDTPEPPAPAIARLNRTQLFLTKISTNGNVGVRHTAKKVYVTLCDQAKNQHFEISLNTNPREEAKIEIIFSSDHIFEGTADELKTILLNHRQNSK